MFPRPKPERNNRAGLAVNSPPQPYLTLFIMVKTLHFIHFNADSDVFPGSRIFFVHIICQILFFLICAVRAELQKIKSLLKAQKSAA
jgi:hypothetical protein